MSTYCVGVDLGQMRDPSTIAVVERAELRGDWDGALFTYRKVIEMRLRALERLPLETPYPDVVRRVVEATNRLEMQGGRVELLADGTGSGRRETSADGYYYVPKRELIVGLQVVFQNGELRIAEELEEGRTLARELAGVQVKVTPAGNEQFAAWREGEHDDLVFAVALACWGLKRSERACGGALVFPAAGGGGGGVPEVRGVPAAVRELRGRRTTSPDYSEAVRELPPHSRPGGDAAGRRRSL